MKPHQRAELLRRRLYEAMGLPTGAPIPCPYCGCELRKKRGAGDNHPRARTRDHVIPKSRGGKIRISCCQSCNRAKANKSPAEWQRYVAEHWPQREQIVAAVFEAVARTTVEAEEA